MFRFFVDSWPQLTLLVFPESSFTGRKAPEASELIGVIVCKLDQRQVNVLSSFRVFLCIFFTRYECIFQAPPVGFTLNPPYFRGYIGMVVVHPTFRGLGMALVLLKLALARMEGTEGVYEVMLEAEGRNQAALGE
jgi:ribosomal protein S18 acetylase RimI-like enzyme